MENKFDYRNTEESDMPELIDWWKWWKFRDPHRLMLPDNINNGMMVSLNGENICAGFVYSTSASSLFHVEFIVSNYNVKDRIIRSEALDFLILGLKHIAVEMGAKIIYTHIVHPNLVKRFIKLGYLKGSENSTELVYLNF